MKRITLAVLSVALLALATGCANVGSAFGLMPVAQHRASLQAVSAATGSIADEHLAWAGAIAQQPGAKPLPDLSKATDAERAAWYRARLQRHDELRAVLTTQASQ